MELIDSVCSLLSGVNTPRCCPLLMNVGSFEVLHIIIGTLLLLTDTAVSVMLTFGTNVEPVIEPTYPVGKSVLW